ncbi:hypothetical protein EW146_g9922, partial [Bondarzewia mesenterica]
MDDEIVLALELIKSAGPRTMSKGMEEWNTEDGLILFRGRIYVPKDQDLRREIVRQHHDPPAAGHPGEWKTVERVQRDFWWPGMTTFIKEYVKGCAVCQASKNQPNRAKVPIIPILADVHALPFQVVSTDFITDLPLSKGFDSISVFVDHDVSKGVVFAPCHKNITAVQTADLYKNQVWRHYGLPSKIISDRGPQYSAKVTRELCKKLGIKQAMSTAYHPQTDGQTERTNQSLE